MAKRDAPDKDAQPTQQLPTSFTFHDIQYGIDEEGKIWRRYRGGTGWVAAGAALPEVALEDQWGPQP